MFVITPLLVTSQAVHFSQFFDSPTLLNPAHTGNIEGDWRLVNNYRSQWSALAQPYQTSSLGYDRPLYWRNHQLSMGLLLLHDQSGSLNFSSTRFYASAAYHTVKQNNVFHIGLQAGWVYNAYQSGALTLPDQYDRFLGDFNSQLPTADQLDAYYHYPDINLGIIWEHRLAIGTPTIGYAISHLNNPKTQVIKNSELENRNGMQHSLFVDVPFSLSSSLTISPRYLLLVYGNTYAGMVGMEISHAVPANLIRTLYGGAYLRHIEGDKSDAAILVAGLKFANFKLGLNYDINISHLQEASRNRGAFEISLIFLAPSHVIDRLTIPSYRL